MSGAVQVGSTTSGAGPHGTLRLRSARRRAAVALGLSALIAVTTGCRRGDSSRSVDPAVQAWYEDAYIPAVDAMSTAAGGAADLKTGCSEALRVLQEHEATLVDTPDDELNRIVQEFVDNRKAAYEKCAGDGVAPDAGPTGAIQRRVNELNEAADEG